MKKVAFLASLAIVSGNVLAVHSEDMLSRMCSSSHPKVDIKNQRTNKPTKISKQKRSCVKTGSKRKKTAENTQHINAKKRRQDQEIIDLTGGHLEAPIVLDTDGEPDDFLVDPEIKEKIDIFINSKKFKYTEDQVRSALRDYVLKKEIPVEEIASLHEMSFETLRKWAREAGIVSRVDIKKPMQKIRKLREENPYITKQELSRKIHKTEQNIRHYDTKINKLEVMLEQNISEEKVREIEEDYEKGWWYPKGLAVKHKLPLFLIDMIISEARKKGITVESVREKYKSRKLFQNEIEKIKKDFLDGELTYNGIIHFNKASYPDVLNVKNQNGLTRKKRVENNLDVVEYLWDLVSSQNKEHISINKSEYSKFCSKFNITNADLQMNLCVINEWLSMDPAQKETLQKIANNGISFDHNDRFFRNLKKDIIEKTSHKRNALNNYKINETYQKYAFVLSKVSDEKFAEKFKLDKRQVGYIKNKAKRLKVVINKESQKSLHKDG